MTGITPLAVHRPEDLTADWLTGALLDAGVLGPGEVIHSFSAEPVGTGQMADTMRVHYRTTPEDGSPRRSVIAKFASADERSRSTGVMTRAYEIEVGFYGQVAGRVSTMIPSCYLGRCEPETGRFVLLLEDVADGVQGEQVAGCSPDVAEAALVELAGLHGATWDDPGLARLGWLQRGGPEADEFLVGLVTSLWPGFVERYGRQLDPGHQELCERFVGVLGPWLATRPTSTTVVHGDFRLDNLLFRPGQRRPYVVDWQTAAWGPAAADLSYFLGASLTVEDRRAHGDRLIAAYHRALLAHGVEGFGLDRLRQEYRTECLGGLVMSIGASMLVRRTDRGDEMFVTSVARYAQQALDLDSMEPSASWR